MAIYDPKSMKAEEFINDAEIRETIAYANANKNNIELIDALLEKARPKKNGSGVTCAGLTHREAPGVHCSRGSLSAGAAAVGRAHRGAGQRGASDAAPSAEPSAYTHGQHHRHRHP